MAGFQLLNFYPSRISNTFIWFFCLFLCTSLSTNGQVEIRTDPTGVQVLNSKDEVIGKTPYKINKSGSFPMNLKIYTEGFDTTFITYGSFKNEQFFFSEALLKCDPCRADLVTPSAESKSVERDGVLKLRKEFSERDQLLMVAVDTPKIAMAENAMLGTINGSKKYRNDDEISRITGFVHNIDNQLLYAFENAGILASFYKIDKKDRVNLYKPKIIFKPVIKNTSFQLKGKMLRDYTGPCQVDCDWQISLISNPAKVIATIPLKTSFYRTSDNYELIIHQMIWESQRDLVEIDTLFSYLVKIEKDYLINSKTEPISITPAAPLKFTNSKEMIKEASKAVVIVEEKDGYGSGFFVSPDGFIITNYHVVSSEKDIKVKLPNGDKLPAEIVRINNDFDLALLKVAFKPEISLNFESKSDVSDEIYAIGTPLGKNLGQTITKGIISGYRDFNGVRLIQTDVSINEGSSGGPLLNENGKVLGMATMKAKGAGIEGIGFGIPASIILEKLNISFK